MSKRVGLWMIGAHGGVATTVVVGLAALKNGLLGDATNCGLVSQLPQFSHLPLIDWGDVVLGGHEIRKTDGLSEAFQLAGTMPAISRELVIQCQSDLEQLDSNVVPGVLSHVGKAIGKLASRDYAREPAHSAAAIEMIEQDLLTFQDKHKLDSVVVVNLASTEPPVDASQFPDSWEEMKASLGQPEMTLPASSLYAIAAIGNGLPYINFTPSLGSCLPAIEQLAVEKQTCHYGHDGKTGETFMKSVLAPAFAQRNLEIMSWVGHNIFGNMDGQVLEDPANKQTKVTSKDQLLGEILGYNPQTLISIEYIRSMGDWKTAWDHIHYRGFLGTPMTLTFTWQGCDSILAAPLVLDLVRFTDLARRKGETGLLTFLSSFFKSPMGTSENEFSVQFSMLTQWSQQFAD